MGTMSSDGIQVNFENNVLQITKSPVKYYTLINGFPNQEQLSLGQRVSQRNSYMLGPGFEIVLLENRLKITIFDNVQKVYFKNTLLEETLGEMKPLLDTSEPFDIGPILVGLSATFCFGCWLYYFLVRF
jgi:hypothetical protein